MGCRTTSASTHPQSVCVLWEGLGKSHPSAVTQATEAISVRLYITTFWRLDAQHEICLCNLDTLRCENFRDSAVIGRGWGKSRSPGQGRSLESAFINLGGHVLQLDG